ncbi:FtsX-like permease family protein [Luxibacter massiliensis]|uniref:FtsX-like permease family protein n=1 Tax=Luxibacter massiliensis TaxID=2219695 RepID=UPI000F071DFB|nr:ABC transporter permease [Luxibacter massiliensis]
MYAKLVFRNVKRSVKDYLLYIVTITICVAMFYAFLSISSKYYNPVIGAEFDITMLAGGMKIAICAVSLLLLFLINYVNRYMLQKRQKEFAVEMITGMEQKTIGRIFFAETFLLSFLSLSAGIIMGMLASQFITAMLLASFGKTYAFTWTLFPDTVLLTAGFFMLCQIVVGMGNVRILNKSKIIELMTSDRRNEKPLHKSRWMMLICIFYGVMLLWMVESGIVNYELYFDNRHPLPVKLMYWGNVLFPILTLAWEVAAYFLKRKKDDISHIGGILVGAICTAVPAFSIPMLENTYFLGFDTPTQNKYLLFVITDILFIISAIIYLANTALIHWKESSVQHKYKNTNLFLFGQISSKLSTNTKTMTIICITLTFSICLFVIAPILSGWSLGYLDKRSICDIQISSLYNHVYQEENLPDTDYEEITKFLEMYNISADYDIIFSEYLPKKEQFHQRVKYNFPPLALAVSDYNDLRKMLGYEPIKLAEDEFTTQWTLTAENEDIEEYIDKCPILETDAGNLRISENSAFQNSMGESIYNLYTDFVYIIPDEATGKLLQVQRNRFVKTSTPLSYNMAAELENILLDAYPEDSGSTDSADYNNTIHTSEANRIISSNFVLKASMIYGAVVLMVMCLTVLALQQLLDAGKYRYRFSVLRKLGVEEPQIGKLVLKQLSVWFGFPIIVSVIVSTVVLTYFIQTVATEISAYIGFGTLMLQLCITIGILVLLLICYFISTWILFRRSI